MIQSKNEVVIDAMEGKKAVVFFDTSGFYFNEKEEKVSFLVHVFTRELKKVWVTDEKGEKTLKEKPVLVPQREKAAIYKMSTFLKIMEGISFSDYATKKNELMIEQIDYNSGSYFGLKSKDLIVSECLK